ncbi:hypothetical protein M422DRAFT_53773 [Sphaerobolus stellatus SS14]|uniref:Uncharacterized protein n=1 Tax=Sphaerobolus stellatus (strain SS14) TaxID=990650 RepID=A0A0C9U7N0_SPHS4|nr:hypothetical protein M422DRAFT_53773 [Sphaerobolus stellatus SS14]
MASIFVNFLFFISWFDFFLTYHEKTRFAASEDKSFQPCGSHTKIDYQEDFEFYLKYLHEGLHSKAPSVLDIIKTWNQVFYPKKPDVPKNITSSGDDEDLEGMINDLHTEGAEPVRADRQDSSQCESETQCRSTEAGIVSMNISCRSLPLTGFEPNQTPYNDTRNIDFQSSLLSPLADPEPQEESDSDSVQ